MPYIRDVLGARDDLIDGKCVPGSAGDLNFLFTHFIVKFLKFRGLSYSAINEVIGALECAKLEMYRRVAVPYEEIKIQENGDVYPDSLLTEEED